MTESNTIFFNLGEHIFYNITSVLYTFDIFVTYIGAYNVIRNIETVKIDSPHFFNSNIPAVHLFN